MKKLSIVLMALILLLVIAVLVIASQAGSLIKNGVETYGPEFTGAPVTLRDLDISILSGDATLNGLMVGNPKGFKSDSAFRVDKVAVKLDVASLFSDQIRIEKILINGANLTYEQINKHSNLEVLKRNIETKIGSASSNADTNDTASKNIQLQIDDLYINGTKVNIIAALLGEEMQEGVTIPDMHLADLGKNGNGDVAVVVDEVVRLITKAATKAAINELGKRKIQQKIDEKKDKALQKLNDKLGDKLKDLF